MEKLPIPETSVNDMTVGCSRPTEINAVTAQNVLLDSLGEKISAKI